MAGRSNGRFWSACGGDVPRLAVEFVLELLAAGEPESEILRNYPGLTRDDVPACLSYARHLAHPYKAYPIPASMRLPATPAKLGLLVRSALRIERDWIGHVGVVTAEGIQMLLSERGLAG